jgi:hypothetical protein
VPDVVVVPDVVAVTVAVVPVPVVAVDEASVPVVDVAADPVDDSPDDDELVVDDSEDVPVVSAAAKPWPVATAMTSHAATAMPPYPPSFAALWAALRDGAGLGALDEGEANKGLAGRWISVMGSTPMAFQWWDPPLIDRSNGKVAHVYHDPKFPVNPQGWDLESQG